MKQTGGDFFAAWGGIASLQLSLSAVWTGRAHARRRTGSAQRMDVRRPGAARGTGDRERARSPRIGRGHRRSGIQTRALSSNPAELRHRHPVTPYAGRELFGVVRATYVGGRRVFHDSLTRDPFAIMTTPRSDFTDLPNLAGERFGTAVIAANDEFFAPKEGLIKAGPPEWREGLYTERGKWMDGWETRRRRTPGLRLGDRSTRPSRDRSRRRHRYELLSRATIPSARASTRATSRECRRRSRSRRSDVEWWPLLAPVDLIGNAPNEFAVDAANARGDARSPQHLSRRRCGASSRPRRRSCRMSGTLIRRARSISRRRNAAGSSSRAATCTTGIDRTSFSRDDRRTWATAGRRSAAAVPATTGRSFDWLGAARYRRVELDTDHYKGNAPGACMLEFCDVGADAIRWHSTRETRTGRRSLPRLRFSRMHATCSTSTLRKRRTFVSASIPTAESRVSE